LGRIKQDWPAVALLTVMAAVGWGCGVKRTVEVPVPARIAEAKTAGLEELLTLMRERSDKVRSLSSASVKVTLTSGKVESGRLQEYRSAPGYVLLRRPDAIRLNVQNPISKTTILDMLSAGDEFSIWYPRENRFYTGKNSIREFETDSGSEGGLLTARPAHLLNALLPNPFAAGEAGVRVALEEEQDAGAKYYVLSLFREKGGHELQPLRRVWIERSQLVPVREVYFTDEGSIASITSFSNFAPTEGLLLPLSVMMNRPADGYSLNLQMKSWRVNPSLPADAFVLTPPAGAEQVALKEKGKAGGI